MIKKLLSLFTAVTMLFSCVTFARADELGATVTDLAASDACFVRNGTSLVSGTQIAYRDYPYGGSQLVFVMNANDKRQSYIKFDFAEYMDTIDYITDIRFSLVPSTVQLAAGSVDGNYTIELLPDSMENWSSSTLTYAMAETAGMTANSAGTLLDSVGPLAVNTRSETGDISEAIKSHLKTNTSNTTVAFKIKSSIYGTYVANPISSSTKAPKLSITVEITAEDIVDQEYDKLTFDKINSGSEASVTSNFRLPTSGAYGTTITWSSTDENTINPHTGIIARPLWNEPDKEVTLTALIQNGGYSRTRTFTVTVPNSSVYPDDMVLESYCYAADSTYIRVGKTDIYQGSLVLDSRNKNRMGFVKFDFTGYEDYLANANSMQLRLDTSTDVVSTDEDNFVVYVLPEEYEDIDTSTLIYTTAKDKGLVDYEDNLIWVQEKLKASTAYRSEDILSAIKKNIDEGDDKVVWLKVDSTKGVGYTMQGASAAETFKPALIIKYPKPATELDYYDLTIPTIVDSDIALPALGQFGSRITWASSDGNLISDTGAVTVATADEDYSVEDSHVTMTATISADGCDTLTKAFEVRVRRNGIVDAKEDATITSDGAVTDEAFVAVGGTVGRIALVSFDVAEMLSTIKGSRKTVLKLYGQEEYADKSLTVVPVTDPAISSDGIDAISYSDAQNIINADNPFRTQVNFASGSYVTFDVTEYLHNLSGDKAMFAICSDEPRTVLHSMDGALGKEPKLVVSPIAYTDLYAAQTVASELDWADITAESADSVRKNLALPTSGRFGAVVEWSSSNDAVAGSDGTVIRQLTDTNVALTAKITVGTDYVTKSFDFTVRKAETDLEYAQSLAEALAPDYSILTSSITLKGESLPDGAVASWQSSEPYEAKVNGFELELTRPNSADLPVVLTVSVNYNGSVAQKGFNVTVVRSPNKNILRNRKIVAGDAAAEKAVDEAIETVWNISSPAVSFDLGLAKVISGMTIVPEISSFSGLTISVSEDSYQWKTVYNGGSFECGKLNYITFEPIAYGRYMKLEFPDSAKAISFIGAYNSVDESADDVFAQVTVPSEASADFSLVTTLHGNAVKWTSSSNAITINGSVAKVTRGDSATNVTLTAQVTINNETQTKSYVVYVPAKERTQGGGGGSSSGGGTFVASPAVTPQAPSISSKQTFADISEAQWAEEYITYLADKGIVSGKSADCFAPNDNLKREEMAKIIALAFDLAEASDVSFADVSPQAWYAPYVASLYAGGITNGMGDGSFGIGLDITRQDAFTMIAKVLGLDTSSEAVTEFGDDSEIADYARGSINALRVLGIVGGDNNGMVNPTAKITRAEIAKVICLAIGNK